VPEVPLVSGASDLAAAVEAVFEEAGALARVLSEFESRPGQREMAAAVARIFARGGTLLAEAGTGTGKTLAYLVPALLSGRRTLVSTGTKNLQEQIFYKDLPILREALGMRFAATYMKGRGNYLCLHRFEALRAGAGPRPADDLRALRLIDEWAGTTETGDRAEIEDLPDDLPFWGEIAATAERCLGTSCPRYDECYITRMRQRAAESDLVIVNHHLLCADAAVRRSVFGEVIPACEFAILDEAHQLEDVATQYFGLAVSSHRVQDFQRDAERLLGAGLVADPVKAVDLKEDVDRIRQRARVFFDAAILQRPGAAERVEPGPERSRGREALFALDGAEPPADVRVRLTPAALQRIADEIEVRGEDQSGALEREYAGGLDVAPVGTDHHAEREHVECDRDEDERERCPGGSLRHDAHVSGAEALGVPRAAAGPRSTSCTARAPPETTRRAGNRESPDSGPR